MEATLARARLDQRTGARFAVEHAGLFRALGKLPAPLFHRGLAGAAWLETWLRYPLATLRMLDGLDETIARIDPKGDRFGLDRRARNAFRDNLLYHQVSDLMTLLLNLEKEGFRRKAFRVENPEVLRREVEAGPGAIVAGFRVGAYPAVPWALATLDLPVSMIVGNPALMEMGEGLGRSFLPRLAERVRYLNARDPRALAGSTDALRAGGVVCTLVELSPIEFQKTMPVRFLDWDIEVPYGIPYLAAMTGRTIVPAMLLRGRGPRYRLRFCDPLPPPVRGRAAVRETTQRLYEELERQVRRYPGQWVGWTLLGSHLGVDLDGTAPPPIS